MDCCCVPKQAPPCQCLPISATSAQQFPQQPQALSPLLSSPAISGNPFGGGGVGGGAVISPQQSRQQQQLSPHPELISTNPPLASAPSNYNTNLGASNLFPQQHFEPTNGPYAPLAQRIGSSMSGAGGANQPLSDFASTHPDRYAYTRGDSVQPPLSLNRDSYGPQQWPPQQQQPGLLPLPQQYYEGTTTPVIQPQPCPLGWRSINCD